ncbi:hypothetical protein WN55_03184 [Dufourea novaeangliae]|uniref:Uncharacterized protein n=1 Tax=Dufourea novaeangliae TaxID=178035 RepID=A0A154PJV5_DUFNO|nr:hypothetical protein WN55_03184 [Dufourea novaeangliae]
MEKERERERESGLLLPPPTPVHPLRYRLNRPLVPIGPKQSETVRTTGPVGISVGNKWKPAGTVNSTDGKRGWKKMNFNEPAGERLALHNRRQPISWIASR